MNENPWIRSSSLGTRFPFLIVWVLVTCLPSNLNLILYHFILLISTSTHSIQYPSIISSSDTMITESSSSTQKLTQNSNSNYQDQQIQEWGTHCSLSSCNMLDFLPFKCSECQKSYCSNHFKASLIQSESNHFCHALSLKTQAAQLSQSLRASTPASDSSTNSRQLCSFVRCKTPLITPIICPACRLSHCPTHRLPPDHLCKVSPTPSSSSINSSFKIKTSFNPSFLKPLITPSNPPPPQVAIKLENSSNSTPGPLAPFAKVTTRYRAKAEIESQKKALEFRAQHGLLTEQDKLTLSAMNCHDTQDRSIDSNREKTPHHNTSKLFQQNKNLKTECLIV
ncbi:hypothetical protein O181_060088 [Austropuccinia psidii MF-1]|uniref:AN1-type domain-containing protein n=1 Tax=Austropuccinia psidii MF-1 TaxID=1389203 RepID=A0A9Q3HX68_9BASI|nr:hypothetical protein [Austropuccinia psidii MF-1]